MIKYDPGFWGVWFIFRLEGSVWPKSAFWGVTSGAIAYCLHVYVSNFLPNEGVNLLWAGYTSVLGFLVAFRNNEAYGRFWEGTALIHQVRGEWLTACSGLIAFCSGKKEKLEKVKQFQAVLVRLMSMLHCAALQNIAEVADDCFEIISPLGIDPDRVRFLTKSKRRTEILVQWIQRIVVEAAREGVLDIPPPILSRVFQELSRGVVNMHNVRKIKDVPLPFPYAQMMSGMMLIHWLLTPLIASQCMASPLLACVLTAGIQTALWSVVYIAMEIDQPFGEDTNDLPMANMQVDFNDCLALLLQERVQTAPDYANFIPEDALTEDDEDFRCRFGEVGIERVISQRSMKPSFAEAATAWIRVASPGTHERVPGIRKSTPTWNFSWGRRVSERNGGRSSTRSEHSSAEFGSDEYNCGGREGSPDRKQSPPNPEVLSTSEASRRSPRGSKAEGNEVPPQSQGVTLSELDTLERISKASATLADRVADRMQQQSSQPKVAEPDAAGIGQSNIAMENSTSALEMAEAGLMSFGCDEDGADDDHLQSRGCRPQTGSAAADGVGGSGTVPARQVSAGLPPDSDPPPNLHQTPPPVFMGGRRGGDAAAGAEPGGLLLAQARQGASSGGGEDQARLAAATTAPPRAAAPPEVAAQAGQDIGAADFRAAMRGKPKAPAGAAHQQL